MAVKKKAAKKTAKKKVVAKAVKKPTTKAETFTYIVYTVPGLMKIKVVRKPPVHR